ncbi:hypothetical protein NHF48_010560 [Sphingomonas sp. H160509]|uniref:hypothetical protein n=1 Tax=Sphingomonas sp. H160509 TaxID=2955313 RepID=UPI002097FA9D|nr:hypothetical protein [Sphingomonas sp. H160509]MDD1451308.1 hypothetical protein [Sphingomonas sp. H160509]
MERGASGDVPNCRVSTSSARREGESGRVARNSSVGSLEIRITPSGSMTKVAIRSWIQARAIFSNSTLTTTTPSGRPARSIRRDRYRPGRPLTLPSAKNSVAPDAIALVK